MTYPATTIQGRIIALLERGMPASKIANVVGCTVGYVSQIAEEEGVSSLIGKKVVDDVLHDKRLDGLEDRIIDRLEKQISQPHVFSKASEALHALRVINGLKRRAAGLEAIAEDGGAPKAVIQLTLPQIVVNNFYSPVVDSNNNVIKIGDEDMITIQSSVMPSLVHSTNSNHIGDNHEHHVTISIEDI